MLESVLLKSGKRERPHSSSKPLKCCFCDRSTDQSSKPRGANPCSYAPGKIIVFEAYGICVLCRQTVKHVDLSWASIAPQALRWRRLLTLNSLPICLTEGPSVFLFPLSSSSPILYLNSPPVALHNSRLCSSFFPFSFFPSSSFKLSIISTFSLHFFPPFKLFLHLLPSSK